MKISVNPKFHFLYDDKELSKYREFIFYGGRGGGKRRRRFRHCPAGPGGAGCIFQHQGFQRDGGVGNDSAAINFCQIPASFC